VPLFSHSNATTLIIFLQTSPLSMPGQNDLVWQSNQSEKQQGINTHTCSHIPDSRTWFYCLTRVNSVVSKGWLIHYYMIPDYKYTMTSTIIDSLTIAYFFKHVCLMHKYNQRLPKNQLMRLIFIFWRKSGGRLIIDFHANSLKIIDVDLLKVSIVILEYPFLSFGVCIMA
jgi:hypothetical protein